MRLVLKYNLCELRIIRGVIAGSPLAASRNDWIGCDRPNPNGALEQFFGLGLVAIARPLAGRVHDRR